MTACFPARTVPIAPLAMRSAPAGILNLGLTMALVVGTFIGSRIFGLPLNMAAGVGAGASLTGWAITGVSIMMLATRKPERNNSVYAQAQALPQDDVAFASAWNNSISAWTANVVGLVAAFGALGYFFQVFGNGNAQPGAVFTQVKSTMLIMVRVFISIEGPHVRGRQPH